MSILSQIKVGDRIRFKSWTRYHKKEAVRIVHKVDERYAYVSYFGCNKSFMVEPYEIIEIIKNKKYTINAWKLAEYLFDTSESLIGLGQSVIDELVYGKTSRTTPQYLLDMCAEITPELVNEDVPDNVEYIDADDCELIFKQSIKKE